MGRFEKHDVDYFPFYAKYGRTLRILEGKYQCKGTGFFTNVLRFLCFRPDHHFSIEDPADRSWFFAEVFCDEKSGMDMLKIMVMSGKLDKVLWEQKQVLASQDFLDSIQFAYKKRNNKCITMEEIRDFYGVKSEFLPDRISGAGKTVTTGFPAPEKQLSDHSAGFPAPEKQQSAHSAGFPVTETRKVKKSKEKNKTRARVRAGAREGDMQNLGHFSEAMGEHLEKINQLGSEIERDGFKEIWSLIQEWFKKGFHPSLIREVLEGGAPYIKGKKNQQGYIRAIMKTKAQNLREKGFIQEHEKQQADFKGFVDMLKSFARGSGSV